MVESLRPSMAQEVACRIVSVPAAVQVLPMAMSPVEAHVGRFLFICWMRQLPEIWSK